jgi:hypothetical protein
MAEHPTDPLGDPGLLAAPDHLRMVMHNGRMHIERTERQY